MAKKLFDIAFAAITLYVLAKGIYIIYYASRHVIVLHIAGLTNL
jgi:hypothetical protein